MWAVPSTQSLQPAEQKHDLPYPISPLVLLQLLLVEKLVIELLLDVKPNKQATISQE